MMNITLDIDDDLLLRAIQLANQSGRPLQAVIEESLRAALSESEKQPAYKLPHLSVGKAGGKDPLKHLAWREFGI